MRQPAFKSIKIKSINPSVVQPEELGEQAPQNVKTRAFPSKCKCARVKHSGIDYGL